jgi:hypothetical protein
MLNLSFHKWVYHPFWKSRKGCLLQGFLIVSSYAGLVLTPTYVSHFAIGGLLACALALVVVGRRRNAADDLEERTRTWGVLILYVLADLWVGMRYGESIAPGFVAWMLSIHLVFLALVILPVLWPNATARFVGLSMTGRPTSRRQALGIASVPIVLIAGSIFFNGSLTATTLPTLWVASMEYLAAVWVGLWATVDLIQYHSQSVSVVSRDP